MRRKKVDGSFNFHFLQHFWWLIMVTRSFVQPQKSKTSQLKIACFRCISGSLCTVTHGTSCRLRWFWIVYRRMSPRRIGASELPPVICRTVLNLLQWTNSAPYIWIIPLNKNLLQYSLRIRSLVSVIVILASSDSWVEFFRKFRMKMVKTNIPDGIHNHCN